MKIAKLIKKLIKERILFITAGSLSLCLILLLLFYSLFLLLPSLFIKTGIIAPLPLLVTVFLFFIYSSAIFIYRKPFVGKKFLNDITLPPYNADDLRSAVELENGKRFPGTADEKEKDDSDKRNISEYLSGKFGEIIIAHVKNEGKIFSDLIPDFRRTTACIAIIFCTVMLSFFKSSLVLDVYSALRSGLPAELVSLDKPVEFEKIEATVTPPAYFEAGEIAFTDLKIHKKIKVMQGSGVTVKGVLKGIGSGKLILSAGKGVEYYSISISENSIFEAVFLAPLKGAFALEFEFTGSMAGSSGKSRIYTIEALQDQPPSIMIFSPQSDYNILFGNPVEINFAASDDYGLLEISLYHRNHEQEGDYFKELVARFPKNPKTNYNGLYVWNPVIREGDKINELVYKPGIKTIEYFLEVKDINTYSSGGISKSEIRYLHFTDALSNLKEGTELIRELIDEGKKLLQSPSNKRMLSDYKNKLMNAASLFSKDLLETMPQSTLVQKTNEMLSALYFYDSQKVKDSLRSYIAYLERYLVFIELLLQSRGIDTIDNEISKMSDPGGDLMSSLKSISRAADVLENEFRKDFEEVEELIKKGDRTAAKGRLDELLQKIKKRMSEEFEKSMGMSQNISAEMKERLNKMYGQASVLLKKQELNKTLTDKGNIKPALRKQEEINEGLSGLSDRTEKLASEYPFVMYALSAYAGAAKSFGEKASGTLKIPDPIKSSQDQSRVIHYLKNFIDSISRQKQLMEELSKGNFESMQRGYTNRFVFIPKEAVYTIPIDYKNKIMEMSKDRSRLTKEKEAFWRDILE